MTVLTNYFALLSRKYILNMGYTLHEVMFNNFSSAKEICNNLEVSCPKKKVSFIKWFTGHVW